MSHWYRIFPLYRLKLPWHFLSCWLIFILDILCIREPNGGSETRDEAIVKQEFLRAWTIPPHGEVNPFMPTGAFNICCPRDCVSRHLGGTSGAPLKPLRVDSALRALSTLRGLRGAAEGPPLCRETQSLGHQMLELSCENATVGTNGLSCFMHLLHVYDYLCIIYMCRIHGNFAIFYLFYVSRIHGELEVFPWSPECDPVTTYPR